MVSEGYNRPPDQVLNPRLQQFVTLDDISVTLRKVLKELSDEADVGEKEFYSGTATTTIAVIDLTKVAPYHPVKSFTLANDSADDIYFTHNNTNNSNMNIVRQNETIPITYNRRVINKIFLKTLAGSSNYRVTLYW